MAAGRIASSALCRSACKRSRARRPLCMVRIMRACWRRQRSAAARSLMKRTAPRSASLAWNSAATTTGPRCYGGGRSQRHVSCRLSKTSQEHAMTEQSAPAATAFDHASTLVLALELSGKGWEVGAVLPGVARRPRRVLTPRDMAGLLKQIERWKTETQRTGRTVRRTVLTYEAGRDGFWIARYLLAHGIEGPIMQPASRQVERRGR